MYNLKNRTKFNVTSEVSIKVTPTGQQIALVAIHRNRTVKFMTAYDVSEQNFKQHSKVELGPTAWFEYRLDLLNKTTVICFGCYKAGVLNKIYSLHRTKLLKRSKYRSTYRTPGETLQLSDRIIYAAHFCLLICPLFGIRN